MGPLCPGRPKGPVVLKAWVGKYRDQNDPGHNESGPKRPGTVTYQGPKRHKIEPPHDRPNLGPK